MTQDNGARALAERLDGIGQGFDGCEYAPVLDVDTARMDDLHHGPEYADAILANGAAFLPDAAELDRLRAALDRIASMASEAMGREPVHTLAVLSEMSRIARAAPSPEPLPREALTLALVAEALFEARIGAPADALLLAEMLHPVLLRLFASPDRPTPP